MLNLFLLLRPYILVAMILGPCLYCIIHVFLPSPHGSLLVLSSHDQPELSVKDPVLENHGFFLSSKPGEAAPPLF